MNDMTHATKPTRSRSEELADWYLELGYADLPPDIIARTRLHVLDIIGLALAGAARDSGRSLREGIRALGTGNECRVLGFGDATTALLAALANGTMAHSMEFDDTHGESITHIANSVVTTALTIAQTRAVSGADAMVAIAGGNEIACRIGVVAPGKLHAVGYHATGVIGTMSATYTASRLLGLDGGQTRHAVGIAGSQAAGIMECWSDGTWSKFLHPGFAAHNALIAANLAKAGFTGPATVFEGRFGLYKSHLQNPEWQFDYARMVGNLGTAWESRAISFKPYPTAHFVHSFLDALLYLVREHDIRPGDVERIVCPIAHYMIPIVCEPLYEKMKPATDWHARVSLQYSLAEALYHGELTGRGYAPESLTNPKILEIAAKVQYEEDRQAPGHEQFKGWVIIETRDGRRFERIEPYNRGSAEYPMSDDDIKAKFRDNASLMLKTDRVERIVETIAGLERVPDVRELVALCY